MCCFTFPTFSFADSIPFPTAAEILVNLSILEFDYIVSFQVPTQFLCFVDTEIQKEKKHKTKTNGLQRNSFNDSKKKQKQGSLPNLDNRSLAYFYCKGTYSTVFDDYN